MQMKQKAHSKINLNLEYMDDLAHPKVGIERPTSPATANTVHCGPP